MSEERLQKLSTISLEQLRKLSDGIKYQVKVTNGGKVGGAVSVLAYVTSTVCVWVWPVWVGAWGWL